MTDEPQNDRIINGLLKADIGLLTPEQVQQRLSQNVRIVVDRSRAHADDLWPCVWFLAAILEREFYGQIFIQAGLTEAPSSPQPLGARCSFVDDAFTHEGLSVGVGVGVGGEVWGDTRGNVIAYATAAPGCETANPISGCALAGYLGFALLAKAASIPPFHASWRCDSLALPWADTNVQMPSIAVLGTGQIGQAFLALAFFLAKNSSLIVHLVDRDTFEGSNYRSQLLLSEQLPTWDGQDKVSVIAAQCEQWGWTVTKSKETITWGWKNPLGDCAIGFLGFDNMEARRIGVEGGFKRLVECGVGIDFLAPRVTWHSLPPDRELAKRLFPEPELREEIDRPETDFMQELDSTPGGCGRVVFEGISATAPCLGAVAVALTWTELLRYLSGDSAPVSGGAYVWSPLQPFQRDFE